MSCKELATKALRAFEYTGPIAYDVPHWEFNSCNEDIWVESLYDEIVGEEERGDHFRTEFIVQALNFIKDSDDAEDSLVWEPHMFAKLKVGGYAELMDWLYFAPERRVPLVNQVLQRRPFVGENILMDALGMAQLAEKGEVLRDVIAWLRYKEDSNGQVQGVL